MASPARAATNARSILHGGDTPGKAFNCAMRELRCVQAIYEGVAISAKCGDGSKQCAEDDGGKRVEFNPRGKTDERDRQAKAALDGTVQCKEKRVNRGDAESCAGCGDERRFQEKEQEYLARMQPDRAQNRDLPAAFVQRCV